MTRKLLTIGLLTSALLIFGCSQNEMLEPDQALQSDQGEDLSKAAKGKGKPAFNTIYWPPPNYPVSVMELNHRTGEGVFINNLDIAAAPPGWDGEYPGFATPYGLAYDIDGTLFSIHNWFDGVAEDCFSQLIRIDLETGDVEPIGPVHDINFAGPEFDAYGNLYATGFTVGAPEGGPTWVWGDSNLYRFNKVTGEKTLIGDTGHTEWMDLDFDSEGQLWATFANDLYILDTETGASEFVTHIYGVEDNWIPGVCDEDWVYMEVMGIAFDHRDVLWATAMKGFSGCDDGGLAVPVMTIDIESGVATLVGSSILQGQSHGGDIAPRKVNICHLKNGEYMPIQISIEALPAHLAHGDILPGADGNGSGCQ